MRYLICIPIYADMPHIEENLESLNDWEHLLIIDNSKDSFCKKFEGKGAEIRYFPHNIGVARAWNLGIAENKDYTFFVSSSVKFNKGFKEVADHLERLIAEDEARKAEHLIKGNNIEWGLFTQLGWRCNGISQKTVEKIGIFDQNYYPAYYEDVDYCRRLKLSGIHTDDPNDHRVPMVEIDAQSVVQSACTQIGKLRVDFLKLQGYYSQKWDGIQGEEKSDKPFGCPLLRYWPKADIDELKKRYGLND